MMGYTISGIAAERLSSDELAQNFSDLHTPLQPHEVRVAADRCYFCHDAPCVTACPTDIDIPLFIRQISTGTPEAAAKTIFDMNILGGMCARVCPTEELCEQVCVREVSEGKPVEIGRLQRHATDTLMAKGIHPFSRAAQTGKTVAVVGAGPAGLSCAHRLALLGNDVTIYDARPKAGGLNEYGIAAYKTTNDFAAREIEWLLSIGGITLENGKALGNDLALEDLIGKFDAVFLAVGLGGQTPDLGTLEVGRHVVVIGGGMTAVDTAVQSKLLGAEQVTIAYRRDRNAMSASRYEQDLAAQQGVKLLFNMQPIEFDTTGDTPMLELGYSTVNNGKVEATGETIRIMADQIFCAIGQRLTTDAGLALEGQKIRVNEVGRTGLTGVWAGGDCALGGNDLTVTAVAEGRDAAIDIHNTLMGGA